MHTNNVELCEYPDYLAYPYVRLSNALRASYGTGPIPGLSTTQAGLALLPVGQEFYRLSLQSDAPMFIHYDHPMATTTAILYLNETSACQGGTGFFKHKETGLTMCPDNASPELVTKLAREGGDASKWELFSVAKMEWNKLIVFNSRLFHAPYPSAGWGDKPENGRLVQVWWLPDTFEKVKEAL
jgi:Family of unknown function (DUF6445)